MRARPRSSDAPPQLYLPHLLEPAVHEPAFRSETASASESSFAADPPATGHSFPAVWWTRFCARALQYRSASASLVLTILRSRSRSKFGTITPYSRSDVGSPGRALQRHHANLFHIRRLQIVRLDLLRINILSVRQHDDFLAPPGDEQIPIRIEVPQIARVEPSIPQHLVRCLRTIPISLHHNRAANRDLAQPRACPLPPPAASTIRASTPTAAAVRPIQTRSSPDDSEMLRPSSPSARRHSARRFRKNKNRAAIAGSNRDPPVTRYRMRVAESSVNLAEKNFARVDPHSPQPPVQRHQRPAPGAG